MKTLILTQKAVRAILSMELAVPAVEEAFAAHGRGETQMPTKVYLSLPQHGGDFRAMPSYFAGAAGVKWVNSHPQNPQKHGLRSVMGTYILSDPETAAPLAIMDATLLTAFRTGAGAAVATKHLARQPPRKLGFVGCGVQARVMLSAHRFLYRGLELFMADVNPEAAEKFAQEEGGKAVSLEEASGCDVVCVATPSKTPVVQRAWVKAGAHLNAMGADAPGKQELDPQILLEGAVYVDDLEQAVHSGEVNVPLHSGAFDQGEIKGTLGEVICGKKPGRKGDEITVFDSTGLAIQDLALAKVVYRVAREKKLGLDVELTEG